MNPKLVPGHIYYREVDQSVRTSLSVISALIGMNAKVLDLGTGSGALGKQLSEFQGCQVDGVTYNAQEAEIARPFYRRIEIADLETCLLTDLFQATKYDFIVCADVLEHIRNPERLALECKGLLAPGGQLVVSVPNLGYCGLVAELMGGEFLYREEGLLDRTHVRFFTRRALRRLLQDCGWMLSNVDVIERTLNESEFRVQFDVLPPMVARHLLALPDAMAYQFVATARPSETESFDNSQPTVQPAMQVEGEAYFSCQMYFGGESGFSEDQKIVTRGVIGKIHQTLIFQASKKWTNIQRIRFDPADRIGYCYLNKLSLLIEGRTAWDWKLDQAGAGQLGQVAYHQIIFNPPIAGAQESLLFLSGSDPWIELPIPQNIWNAIPMGASISMEVDIGWPMSADYLALASAIESAKTQVALHKELALKESAHYSSKLQKLSDDYDLLIIANTRITEQEQKLQQALHLLHQETSKSLAFERQRSSQNQELAEALQSSNARLNETLAVSESKALALLSEKKKLADERTDLLARLTWIENSRLFRLTRPLIRAKMRLNPLLNRFVSRNLGGSQISPIKPQKPSFQIDIVVPVYKGLEDTQRCIQSVLASHCIARFRVVVINDASPESAVTEWLRTIAERDDRILLLENEENLGFVGTVNRGMSISDSHDVVLLNSDTEVANDWLDRLKNAAYIDNQVGTVTPFSNNATICSYPIFCGENPMVAAQTTSSLDQIFAKANAGQAIDIPTGVGFCMYIRRECLSSVGLFDVANFGKGYGEENDFCRRAAKAGWRNLHALDTFVLHAGGVSFGSSKNARVDAAMQTMGRLHHEYDRVVQEYLAADPAAPARLQVDLIRIRASIKPAVLLVVHDRSGGTIRHTEELSDHLADSGLFFSLKPIVGGGVNLRLMGSNEGFSLNFYLPQDFEDLIAVLRYVKIQLVHYHHVLGHSDLVLQVPERLNVQFDFTTHDYYSFCPQISLTDLSGKYCGERGIEQCRTCLQKSPAPGNLDISMWREKHLSFLKQARYVYAPSQDAQIRMSQFLGQVNVLCVPHTDLQHSETPIPRTPAPGSSDRPLRIAVIGALSPIKGADLLEDVACASFANGEPLEFHLVGYAYRHLKTESFSNLTIHGEYRETNLPEVLRQLQPDLIWFTALWPETYSYTLSACLASGYPVVAPDLGAFPERLGGRAWSWVEPWNRTAIDWVAFFIRIRTQHFLAGTPPTPPVTGIANHAPPWHYREHYFSGIHASDSPIDLRSEHIVAERLRTKAQPNRPIQMMMKGRALNKISQLRRSKALSALARKIPPAWQARLKTWLQS